MIEQCTLQPPEEDGGRHEMSQAAELVLLNPAGHARQELSGPGVWGSGRWLDPRRMRRTSPALMEESQWHFSFAVYPAASPCGVLTAPTQGTGCGSLAGRRRPAGSGYVICCLKAQASRCQASSAWPVVTEARQLQPGRASSRASAARNCGGRSVSRGRVTWRRRKLRDLNGGDQISAFL